MLSAYRTSFPYRYGPDCEAPPRPAAPRKTRNERMENWRVLSDPIPVMDGGFRAGAQIPNTELGFMLAQETATPGMRVERPQEPGRVYEVQWVGLRKGGVALRLLLVQEVEA